MARFVLRYRGKGDAPHADVAHIRGVERLVVLDEAPRMILVEAPEAELRAAASGLVDWVVVEETMIALLPTPGPKPKA